jgi:glyoxylase-like metal-dependent hydrolase (beta-lactamase superfamily II)
MVDHNIFSLEVLKARKGDCLLLHYGTADEPALALIDGGPGGVYSKFLKPRLKQLREERGLDESEMLPIDLCMLSHIDDDHIHGLLQLTQELVDAQKSQDPRAVNILDLWPCSPAMRAATRSSKDSNWSS